MLKIPDETYCDRQAYRFNKKWNAFVNMDFSDKEKYYTELVKYAKDTFSKKVSNWYINFYKDIPVYFIIMSPEEVKEAFPNAKNWLDIENYM